MTALVTACLGLGSNLGDRSAALTRAVRGLDRHPAIHVTAVSSVIETAAVGGPPQGPYLNAAVAVRTSLPARALLAACLALEAEQGRDRQREPRWGPRAIDLDLLLYGEVVIDEPGLTVPHPHLHRRPFVLVPLGEIAATRLHPGLGRSIGELAAALDPDGSERGTLRRMSPIELGRPLGLESGPVPSRSE